MSGPAWSDCGDQRIAAEQEAREREQARQTALAAERAAAANPAPESLSSLRGMAESVAAAGLRPGRGRRAAH